MLFESIKRIIESGMYDKTGLTAKIRRLESAGRLTAEEAETLIRMMGD